MNDFERLAMAFAMALRIALLHGFAIVIANVIHCSVIVALSSSLSLSSIAIVIAIASAIVRAAAGFGADAIAIASADVIVMHYLPKSLRIVKRRSRPESLQNLANPGDLSKIWQKPSSVAPTSVLFPSSGRAYSTSTAALKVASEPSAVAARAPTRPSSWHVTLSPPCSRWSFRTPAVRRFQPVVSLSGSFEVFTESVSGVSQS